MKGSSRPEEREEEEGGMEGESGPAGMDLGSGPYTQAPDPSEVVQNTTSWEKVRLSCALRCFLR